MKTLLGKIHGNLIFNRRTQVLAKAMTELLPHGSSVVDVGCGDGTIAGLCQTMRPDVQIEGIDVFVRPKTVVPITAFDGTNLPFADRSRDVVVFIDVLHHTRDPILLLKEAARVARSTVIIKDHVCRNLFDRGTLAIMDWVGNAPHGVALPYNYQSPSQWQALFAEVQLTVEQSSETVPLYAFPLDRIFGRRLHFIASLSPKTLQKKQAA